jgi:transcriptional regulator with XRE-family HTH domain
VPDLLVPYSMVEALGVCDYRTVKAVEDWKEVGERVRAARTASDLTQTDLARRINIERTALVRIEAGERGLSALELSRLAEALDIPLVHFVTRSPGPVAAYRAAAVESSGGGTDVAAERTRFLLDVELETHARDAEWLYENGYLVPSGSIPTATVADRGAALELARAARAVLGRPTEPLGSMVTVAEKFGLYVKVVARSTAGASLQIDPGLGVAVVGAQSDPGRRRSTAAHELGHHLFGDKYNSDAGVATSDQDRERLIDTFLGEFLLPEAAVLADIGPDLPADQVRSRLISLAGRYRVSWSAAVNSVRRLGLVDGAGVQRLSAALPGRGDFMAVLGYEPRHDLTMDRSGPTWRRAVLAAWRDGKITRHRTVDLLNGALAPDDLPERESDGAPE